MKASTTLLLAVAAAATFAACRASSSGDVGVKGKKSVPIIGEIEYGVGLGWNFGTTNRNVCGCVTFLGPDGKPLPNTPKGTIAGGRGGGVVPKGATGWEVVLTDEDCDKLNCNPEKPKDATNQSVAGNMRALNASLFGTEFTYIGSMYVEDEHDIFNNTLTDYAITVTAMDRAQADALFAATMDTTTPTPGGVEIHDWNTLTTVFDALGTFQGLTGHVYDNEPMTSAALKVNGVTEQVHIGTSPITSNGLWHYPITVQPTNLDMPGTLTESFRNKFEFAVNAPGSGLRQGEFVQLYDPR